MYCLELIQLELHNLQTVENVEQQSSYTFLHWCYTQSKKKIAEYFIIVIT